jgi:hypothetical protein
LLFQKLKNQKRKNVLNRKGFKNTMTKPKKRGLYANINARKRKGISRPKSKSTISKEAYANMKAGFPKKKKKKK